MHVLFGQETVTNVTIIIIMVNSILHTHMYMYTCEYVMDYTLTTARLNK